MSWPARLGYVALRAVDLAVVGPNYSWQWLGQTTFGRLRVCSLVETSGSNSAQGFLGLFAGLRGALVGSAV